MTDKIERNEVIRSRFNSEHEAWNERYNNPMKDTISYSIYKRRSLIIEEVNKLTELSKKQIRILEIGCGTGNLASELKRLFPDTYIHACDISEDAIKFNKERIPNVDFSVCNIDNENIEFNVPFDLVIMAGVIGYCENIQEVMKKVNSYLNPTGKFILSFGNKQSIYRKTRQFGVKLARLSIFRSIMVKLFGMQNKSSTLLMYRSFSYTNFTLFLSREFKIQQNYYYSFSAGFFKSFSVKWDRFLERMNLPKFINCRLAREILLVCSKNEY